MKNRKNRHKNVVGTLLFASGSAFVVQACAPIVAEFGAGRPTSQMTVDSADICVADSGKGDAQ